MATAAIIVHDGFTDAEFITVYHMLKAEGFDVTVYSPNGGPVTGVCGWIHKTKMATGRITIPIGDGNHEADILCLIGGVKSIEYLRGSRPLIDWIKRHYDANKLIASICWGASLLIETGKIQGRQISGYYNCATDIKNAGACFIGDPVVVDYPFVTSPHYDFSGIWMKEVLRVWQSRNE